MFGSLFENIFGFSYIDNYYGYLKNIQQNAPQQPQNSSSTKAITCYNCNKTFHESIPMGKDILEATIFYCTGCSKEMNQGKENVKLIKMS